MCGIAGVYGRRNQDVFPELVDMLSMMGHRGPDGYGASVKGKTVKFHGFRELNATSLEGNSGIAHCLLSITGHGLQPFDSSKGFSLCHNGQIYNYKDLTDKPVESDSQAIVHFLEGHGSIEKGIHGFMATAVGKYAVAIQDGSELLAFRDVLGIKPMWFGGNEGYYAFASEPIALKKLNMQFPQPLLPGHLLKISKKGI